MLLDILCPGTENRLAPVSQKVLPQWALSVYWFEQPCTTVKSALWRANGARPFGKS